MTYVRRKAGGVKGGWREDDTGAAAAVSAPLWYQLLWKYPFMAPLGVCVCVRRHLWRLLIHRLFAESARNHNHASPPPCPRSLHAHMMLTMRRSLSSLSTRSTSPVLSPPLPLRTARALRHQCCAFFLLIDRQKRDTSRGWGGFALISENMMLRDNRRSRGKKKMPPRKRSHAEFQKVNLARQPDRSGFNSEISLICLAGLR